MARRLVRIGVASTAFVPSVVMALGLGALESDSALNQPLQARIPLESASAQEIETLDVQLASQEAFERVGLDRPFSLSNLEFDVVTEGPDAPYIEVTTSDSVREPFLAFLIELDWSGGRLLREYTLLLDPPVRDGEQAETTVAEGREPDVDTAAPDDDDGTQARTSGRSASPASGGQRPDEIRVQNDDTLWELAEEARQGDVSVHQMMMAMLEANPDAFRDNNVNNLQAGSVLRVPDEEQARALTASEARQRFASQMEAWRSGRTPEPEQPDEEAVAEEEGDGSGQDDGRLEIAGAGDSGGEDATASLMDEDLEANQENVERLQSELQSLRESEAQLQSENEELQQKTDELLDRVRALENTIDLQVERGVPGVTGTGEEESSGTADGATETPDEDAASDDGGDEGDTKSAEDGAEDDSGLVVSQDGDDEAGTGSEDQAGDDGDAQEADQGAGDDEEAAASADDDAASQSDQQQTAAGGGSDGAQATPFWQDYRVMGLGAAGLAALALLGLLLARRRRGEAVDASDTIDETATTAPPVAGAPSQTATVDTAAEDQGADAVAAAMAPEEPEASPAASSAGSDQDVDPLEEIEIYLAYGRYDQAGDLLASAIASEPERKDLRLKQLEIHGLTHDRASFESDAQALYGLVDGPNDPVWQQAREMGREVAPENPLFSDGDAAAQPTSAQPGSEPVGSGAGSDDDFSDLDFSLDDTGPAATQPEPPAEREPAAPAEPAASETESFDLDFDLDDTGAAAGGETAAEPAASGADADETSRTDATASDSLDMEFDLGDLGAPSSGESSDASEPAAETGGDAAAGEDDTPSFSLDELDLGDAESDAQAEEQGLRYEGPEAFASESEPDTGSTDTAATQPASETETGPADAGTEADDGGDDDDLFDAGDENSTKIDLARAYLDMGDGEGARSLLDEVIAEGSDEQKAEARSLYEEAR